MSPLPPKKVVKPKETNREKAFRKQQKEAEKLLKLVETNCG